MAVSEVSGAGIATIAFLWESFFNNLEESACNLKGSGLYSSVDYVAFVVPLLQAATISVLLCLHCALFTLAVIHPRGSLCLIPRPCEDPPDNSEIETRCIQWACIALYLAACAMLEQVVAPLIATFGLGPPSLYVIPYDSSSLS